MSKQFQVLVGGVEMFSGSFEGALETIQGAVAKPRFTTSKDNMEQAEVGTKFAVTSRVKGSGQKATLVVIEVADVVPEPEVVVEPEVVETLVEETVEIQAEATVVEMPKKKGKVKTTPDGIRSASWKWVLTQVDDSPATEITVEKASAKRFLVKIDGQQVWYSWQEEVAEAMAQALRVLKNMA